MANDVDAAEESGALNRRVTTGVAGLDTILGGGLLAEGFYLLQGDPGSGKTTVALQFARECVAKGEKTLYISLSESREDLERTVRSHGWSLQGIHLLDLSKEEPFSRIV